jgi:predicted DNA binding CopG/RHH family protein
MSKKVTFGTKPQPKSQPDADQWVESRAVEEEPNKRLTIDLKESLHTRIKVACAQRGVKMADAIRDILEKEFPAT